MKSTEEIRSKLNSGMEQLSAGLRYEDIAFEPAEPLSAEERRELFGEIPQARSDDRIRRMPFAGLAIAAVFVLLVLATGLFGRIRTAENLTVMLIRINPSVELLLDGTDVKKITPKNRDAEPIVADIDCGLGLETVLDTIILRLEAGGYFAQSGSELEIRIEGPDQELVEKAADRQVIKTIRENNIHTAVVINRKPAETERWIENGSDSGKEDRVSAAEPSADRQDKKTAVSETAAAAEKAGEESTAENPIRTADSRETEPAAEKGTEPAAAAAEEGTEPAAAVTEKGTESAPAAAEEAEPKTIAEEDREKESGSAKEKASEEKDETEKEKKKTQEKKKESKEKKEKKETRTKKKEKEKKAKKESKTKKKTKAQKSKKKKGS